MLLALAVFVALIGIVNTLMLSVFERTREIGLLRAVGMKRRQVRAMIRSEAVIVALFGAVVGIVVGAGLGIALASSLREQRRHEHRRPDPEPDRVRDPRRRARSGRRNLAGPTGRQPRRARRDRYRVRRAITASGRAEREAGDPLHQRGTISTLAEASASSAVVIASGASCTANRCETISANGIRPLWRASNASVPS